VDDPDDQAEIGQMRHELGSLQAADLQGSEIGRPDMSASDWGDPSECGNCRLSGNRAVGRQHGK
jgi:hypothetical protein